ncbi:hypothetical protein [Aurantiacibacter sp. D1-12]|uniref:hypothetical protein n=1 Tax=Aurantiacibacter sp. D1-12 TaxID=2993658 RepID=UPI00237C68B0|nr:hypothetical protein [Aurantiacibacter sp. D1-12]MDE1468348.1 hypothetical protein [Aurantiacibacter sp. D1-12]
MRQYAALLTIPLMLAACQPADGDAENGDAEAPVEVMEEASLDLQATGLIVPPQNGFERLDVPFGSNRSATEATLANVLGEAIDTGGPNDCGLEYTSYAGVTLQFREDAFVGYMAEAPYVPEIPRAEMLGDAGVTLLEDSTIENEFVIGDPQGEGIGGVFAGAEDEAAVEALWAGENCIAR